MLLLRFLIDKRHRIIVYVTTSVTIAVGLALLFFAIFQCGYPKNAEVILLKSLAGKCLNGKGGRALNWMHAVLNAVTDLILVALPIYILAKLQLRRREKILGSVLLLVGARFVDLRPVMRCS